MIASMEINNNHYMNDKRDKDLLIFACKSNNNTLKKNT